MKRIMNATLALFLLCLPATGHGAEFTKVDIAASPAGGAWYVGLGAYVKAISDTYPELESSLFPGGGIANPLRVSKGDSQIGISASSIVKAAVNGQDPYKQPLKVASLGNLHDVTRMHFVVAADSKIQSLRQIVEQKIPVRFGLGPVGGNQELFGRWIMEEYGMSKKQIADWGGKVYPCTNPEALSMMQEGQLDVDVWLGPGEGFRYQELLASMKLRILDVDEDIIKIMEEKYGLGRGVIPASFYKGLMGRDVVTVVAPTELFVNSEISDDLAYKLTKVLVEKRDDIVLALPAWDTMNASNLCQDVAAPLHPGAAKYYRESGCLK